MAPLPASLPPAFAALLGLGLMAMGGFGLAGLGPATQAWSAAAVERRAAPDGAWLNEAAAPMNTRRYATQAAWLRPLHDMAPERRIAWLDAGIADMQAHLARAPADGHAWMVLAWLRQQRLGPVPAVLDALRQSYATGRFELVISVSRIYLALALHAALPEALRREVALEIALMADHRHNADILRGLADAAVAAGPAMEAMVLERAAALDPLAAGLLRAMMAEQRRSRGLPDGAAP